MRSASRVGRICSDPTETSCFLGATLATNASGARSFLWGATRAHVRELDVVLTSGDLIHLRRNQVHAAANGTLTLPLPNGQTRTFPVPFLKQPPTKNSAGYYLAPGFDAVDLFIGQEGTLGVIVQVEVRLIHAPTSIFAGVVFFPNDVSALEWVQTIKTQVPGVTRLQREQTAGVCPGIHGRALAGSPAAGAAG